MVNATSASERNSCARKAVALAERAEAKAHSYGEAERHEAEIYASLALVYATLSRE